METNNKTIPFEVQPRNHYVVVKATSTISLLGIANGNLANDANSPVVFEIMAIGSKVEGLAIGDIVLPNGDADIKLQIASNKKSIASFKSLTRDNASYQAMLKASPKVEIIEYLLYPEYNIVAIKK